MIEVQQQKLPGCCNSHTNSHTKSCTTTVRRRERFPSSGSGQEQLHITTPKIPILFHRRRHNKFLFQFLVSALSAGFLLANCVDAFATVTTSDRSIPDSISGFGFGTRDPCSPLSMARCSMLRSSSSNDNSNNNSDEPILSSASPNAAMSETSRLSHAMLKVPSVDASVADWISKGGTLLRSRSNGKTNGEAQLVTAFVQLGMVGGSRRRSNSDDDDKDTEEKENEENPHSFALEFIQGPLEKTESTERPSIHGLSYLGLSMLLKFQDKNRLLELMMGNDPTGDGDSNDKSTTTSPSDNSNDECVDFPVKYVASAPGDGFAQLALWSDNKLVETCDFYTTILGMDQKAQDQNLLCLRYNNDINKRSGVPTTLVFVNRPGKSDSDSDSDSDSKVGVYNSGCFDHLSINTNCSIKGLYQGILEQNEAEERDVVKIYMKPTPMFGLTVLGLIDPNGYKIVVSGTNE